MNEWQLFEIPQAKDDFTLVILQELTLVDFEVGIEGKIAFVRGGPKKSGLAFDHLSLLA